MTASIVYLNNVRLETGFAKDHHELTYTKTARYTLAIQEGAKSKRLFRKIKSLKSNKALI